MPTHVPASRDIEIHTALTASLHCHLRPSYSDADEHHAATSIPMRNFTNNCGQFETPPRAADRDYRRVLSLQARKEMPRQLGNF